MRSVTALLLFALLGILSPSCAQEIDQAVNEVGCRVADGSIDDEDALKIFDQLIEIARENAEEFRAPERAKLEAWLGQRPIKIRLGAYSSGGGNPKESIPLEIEWRAEEVIIRVGKGKKVIEIKVPAKNPDQEGFEWLAELRKIILSTSEDSYSGAWLLETDSAALLDRFKNEAVPICGRSSHQAVIQMEGKGIDWKWTLYDDRVDRIFDLAERAHKLSR